MRPPRNPLGKPIPAFTEHAISVSLPTWLDNVGYEEGEARVVDAMQSGYPRFFIHLNIKKVRIWPAALPTLSPYLALPQLSNLLEQKFGTPSERSLLFPSRNAAEACRAFLVARDIFARVVQYCISSGDNLSIFLVLFPIDKLSTARQFWQHTGLGISSRLAMRCLAILLSAASPPSTPTHLKPMAHRHYTPKHASRLSGGGSIDLLEADQAVYVEQRYGRNLDVAAAKQAKRALRRRIAGVLVRDESALDSEVEITQSMRGVPVSEHDVFLFPSGMSAIWSAHQLILDARDAKKSVCFGWCPC
jgi:cystathionine gamma-synthase